MARGRSTAKIRKAVQGAFGILTNAHLSGFVTGKIYQGPLKKFCVPGMNCYACPGALGACPLGSLQSFLAGRKAKAPFYVAGFMMTAGMLAGRFICGWLCLFGLFQELLYRIPGKKIDIPAKADRWLRYLKYLFLATFVLLFPIILHDEFGIGAPAFCKWVCPVGTLEGGIPLVLLNASLRGAAHLLYAWKLFLLAGLIVLSVFIYRPFCKYICPLGAFYALFQKISLLRLSLDKEACIHCGQCASGCRMKVDPSRMPDSTECIRCGDCIGSCPKKALSFSFASKKVNHAVTPEIQK